VQVLDLGETPPDKALEKIWENFDAQAAHNPSSYQVRERLRLIAAGGDGTVAWVLQVLPFLMFSYVFLATLCPAFEEEFSARNT
jgi:hypothetical protein